ncbi:group II intron reverse transcriptase/maturase [Anaerotignum sp.]|nr:group II intron reverse transcriptase/maturase [Anaerotignum sp.]
MTDVKKPKKKKLRNAEYYNLTDIFDELYVKSKDDKIFYNLVDIIASEENIKLAYRNIKNNKGSKTAGADKKTILDLQKWETEKLIQHIKNKFQFYTPNKVRRVEIPKGNGKTRPLGIPTIMDRLIQQAILQVLEPICEAKFHERSNGFRPNRSAENAVAQVYKAIQLQKLLYVVDIDIKGFFDNVNHGKLLKQMWTLGIRDKKLLKIISIMLKAEVVGIGFPEKGTPQGGIISPLLSNIVLNELDWWIASQWENMKTKHNYVSTVHPNGSLNRGSTYLALKKTNLKECFVIRYADDFKIFCRNQSDADKMFEATKMWLKDRLGLDISPEKSKVVNLKKNYSEFLGFKIKAIKKSNKYVVTSGLTEKSLTKVSEKLKGQIKKIEKPQNEKMEHLEVNIYNSMVIGIHNYYRIATNINIDLQKIAFLIDRTFKTRLKSRIKKKSGIGKKGYVYKTYADSRQLRYVKNQAIAPIGAIRHKSPMYKPVKVNKYTAEGRTLIHKNLEKINIEILHYLMKNPIQNRSIEYNDNRLALYCAQNGKCYVTGKPLEIGRIHCHHKIPIKNGGRDEYKNLVLIDSDVHKLIHAVKNDVVTKYSLMLKLNYKQRDKLNRYRKKLNLEPILISEV